jgi:uncharacterized protein (UPF0332 family)
MARDRLAAARASLDASFPAAAASSAYYAMLYAARAALSEHDRNAKTHRGVWDLFRETFVVGGSFDEALLSEARKAQRLREGADYDALPVSPDDAVRVVELAARFLAAVETMLGS